MIASIIGLFLVSLLFLCGYYVYGFAMDSDYYKMNKYNENRKTIKLKCFQWLFLRCRKSGEREIFIGAFIQQLLSIIVSFGMIALMIVSLVLRNKDIMIIGFGSIFVFTICLIFVEKFISYKRKKKQARKKETRSEVDKKN